MSQWIGLDIGGANIKVAGGNSPICTVPFPLWKQPELLVGQLASIFENVDSRLGIAVTMTGELADCFSSREAGVHAIVDSVTRSASTRTIYFYNTLGEWFDADSAKKNWNQVAAANWHATATYASRFLSGGNGFLLDVGSTTTDIIPIRNGQPATVGKTDFERLCHNELLYAGVQRTPVCSLCDEFELDRRRITGAREFFATIDDAFMVTQAIPENPARTNTADNRPATRAFAAQRLSRSVCQDAEILGEDNVLQLARQIVLALSKQISGSLKTLVRRYGELPIQFVVGGEGEWFATKIVEETFAESPKITTLSAVLGPKISISAAAYSVAMLAEEADLRIVDRVESPTGQQVHANAVSCRVIKLGGSLLAWSQARDKIEHWLSLQPPMINYWIVGGGEMVEQVRLWNEQFSLPEKDAHWMCVDLMSVTTRFVSLWFPEWQLYDRSTNVIQKSTPGNILFDAAHWLQNDPSLPTSWDHTSDSIAALFARECDAEELVLLKSRDAGGNPDVHFLAEAGIVDKAFPDMAEKISTVRLVNLRDPSFRETLITR